MIILIISGHNGRDIDLIAALGATPTMIPESYIEYYNQQEVLFNNMVNVIQSQRYSPSVIKGQSSVGYYRRTSFCNKRIHCKRKRRVQL